MSTTKVNKPGTTPKGEAPARQANVASIEKAFEVLEAFKERGRFMSLEELTRATGMHKSAVQRFTRTLRDRGYLEQDEATRRYALGRRVLELSYWFLRSHPLTERALPVLVDLRQALGERVDLTLPDPPFAIYAIRMQAKREIFRPALIGRRVPMFCTAAGRAMLACMPEDTAARIVETSDRRAFTPLTKTDPAQILQEIHRARARGFACQSEEWLPAEMVAAAAITDHAGRPIGAVNVAVSTTEWSVAELERRIAAPLVAAAREIGE